MSCSASSYCCSMPPVAQDPGFTTLHHGGEYLNSLSLIRGLVGRTLPTRLLSFVTIDHPRVHGSNTSTPVSAGHHLEADIRERGFGRRQLILVSAPVGARDPVRDESLDSSSTDESSLGSLRGRTGCYGLSSICKRQPSRPSWRRHPRPRFAACRVCGQMLQHG